MRDSGHADPDIDAEYTAEVLGAMIEHVCYIWFSLGRDFDEERMISSLGMVWEKAMLPLPEATSGGGERTATARVEI